MALWPIDVAIGIKFLGHNPISHALRACYHPWGVEKKHPSNIVLASSCRWSPNSLSIYHLTLVIHFLPKTGWFTLTTEISLNPGVSWIFGITVWDLLQYFLLKFMNLCWCPTALADAVIRGCYKTCKQLSLVVDPFTGVKILLWGVWGDFSHQECDVHKS